MDSLVQVFYSRFAAAPSGWAQSREGRRLIAGACRVVKAREGAENARYLLNLITVQTVTDKLIN